MYHIITGLVFFGGVAVFIFTCFKVNFFLGCFLLAVVLIFVGLCMMAAVSKGKGMSDRRK